MKEIQEEEDSHRQRTEKLGFRLYQFALCDSKFPEVFKTSNNCRVQLTLHFCHLFYLKPEALKDQFVRYWVTFPNHQMSTLWVGRPGQPPPQSVSIWAPGNYTLQSTILHITLLMHIILNLYNKIKWSLDLGYVSQNMTNIPFSFKLITAKGKERF